MTPQEEFDLMLLGASVTAPTRHIRASGEDLYGDVEETCAVGAYQVGEYVSQHGKMPTVDMVMNGLNREAIFSQPTYRGVMPQLWDAYLDTYGVHIDQDNDTRGRDVVLTRIKDMLYSQE